MSSASEAPLDTVPGIHSRDKLKSQSKLHFYTAWTLRRSEMRRIPIMPVLLPQLHLFQSADFDDVTLLLFRESSPLDADLLAKVRVQADTGGSLQVRQDLSSW